MFCAEIFDIPDLFLFLQLQGVDFLETKLWIRIYRKLGKNSAILH